MQLLKYLGYLAQQLVGFTIHTRRPGLLLIVVLGATAIAFGFAVQFATPIVIYPFI